MDSLSSCGSWWRKAPTLERARHEAAEHGRDHAELDRRHAVPARRAHRRRRADALLAELGADPLLANEDGTTPLMVAAGLGTNAPGEDPGTEPEVLEAVKVALELGNDLNAVDKNGETAMHGAAYKHVPSVVHFLAEKGARIEVWNQPNKQGLDAAEDRRRHSARHEHRQLTADGGRASAKSWRGKCKVTKYKCKVSSNVRS